MLDQRAMGVKSFGQALFKPAQMFSCTAINY